MARDPEAPWLFFALLNLPQRCRDFLFQHSKSILFLSIFIACFSRALWLLLSGIDIETNKKIKVFAFDMPIS